MRPISPRQVKKACERPPHAKWARPAGHILELFDVEVQLKMAAFGVSFALLAGLFDQGGVAGVFGE